MLVLTRKTGQSIVISGSITLTVSRVSRNSVALAFDAPRQVRIRRSELLEFGHGVDDELVRPPATSSLPIHATQVARK